MNRRYLQIIVFLCHLMVNVYSKCNSETIFDYGMGLFLKYNVTYRELKNVNDLYVTIQNGNLVSACKTFFKHLSNVGGLSVSNFGINSFENGLFSDFNKLGYLKIFNNKIDNIPNGVFNGLQIDHLLLTLNGINYIDPMAFHNMTKLWILDLSHNNLKKIESEWFRDKPAVQFVYFDHNKIKLNGEEFSLINVKSVQGKSVTVKLENNGMDKLDLQIFNNIRCIDTFSFNENNISELLGSFDNANFTRIHLEYNKLRHIERDVIQNLSKHIRFTFLFHNPLTPVTTDLMKSYNNAKVQTFYYDF